MRVLVIVEEVFEGKLANELLNVARQSCLNTETDYFNPLY